MSSSLAGKLEGSVEIDASAEMFHDMLSNRPHHVPNASAEKVQACDLHEGDWGKQGSIICWSYVHDGKAKTSKQLIEAVDPKNKSLTLRVLEGELMEEYKSFVLKAQATPSAKGKGCVVHWVMEYEKLHQGIAHPESFLAWVLVVTKDMGSHLTK